MTAIAYHQNWCYLYYILNDKDMTRMEFLNAIKLSENSFSNNFSHIYGSDYYSVCGVAIRVSDHAKNINSLGYDTYNQGNDFRNYQDAFDYLATKVDMRDKTTVRNDFYEKNRKFVIKDGEYFKTPYGFTFVDIESALNNWWRTKRDFAI